MADLSMLLVTIGDLTPGPTDRITINYSFFIEAGTAHSVTRLYISDDAVLDASDRVMQYRGEASSLSTAFVHETTTVSLDGRVEPHGEYYIFVVLDGDRTVAESNESNNALYERISVTGPPPPSFTNGDDNITLIEPGTYYALGGRDTVRGTYSTDFIFGDAGDDKLFGNGGIDILWGGNGNDLVVGGAGGDILRGGAGRDIFDYNGAFETGIASGTYDYIRDFQKGLDKINLQTIDASLALGGNNAFVWRGSSGFTSSASGEVRYTKVNNSGTANDYTLVRIDRDSDVSAELYIRLDGLQTLTSTDFVL
jgi:hypothetical protein